VASGNAAEQRLNIVQWTLVNAAAHRVKLDTVYKRRLFVGACVRHSEYGDLREWIDL
jgi:flagellar basal body rod protein FlgC